MSLKAVFLTVFSSFLFIFATLAINSLEVNSEPLFYYTSNAFFVSLCVFAFPACFFIIFNGGTDFLSFSGCFSILLPGVIGFCTYFFSSMLGNVILSFAHASPAPVFRPEPSFAAILTVCVIPAFSEELFFRGALLPSWQCFGRWRSVVMTSFLFALMHNSFSSFLHLFLLGILISDLAFISKSITASLSFHFCYNFAWLMLPQNITASPWLSLTFSASALLLLLFLLTVFYRHSNSQKLSVN